MYNNCAVTEHLYILSHGLDDACCVRLCIYITREIAQNSALSCPFIQYPATGQQFLRKKNLVIPWNVAK